MYKFYFWDSYFLGGQDYNHILNSTVVLTGSIQAVQEILILQNDTHKKVTSR